MQLFSVSPFLLLVHISCYSQNEVLLGIIKGTRMGHYTLFVSYCEAWKGPGPVVIGHTSFPLILTHARLFIFSTTVIFSKVLIVCLYIQKFPAISGPDCDWLV